MRLTASFKNLSKKSKQRSGLRARVRGLSLIELMIAIGLGLFLITGILTLVVSTSQTRVELQKTSEQIENGRYALQLLIDDVHSAGFYGVPQPSADVHTTPDPCVTTDTLSNLLLGFVAPDTTKLSLPAPVYGYAAGSSLPTCLTDVKAGSEVLVVRYVDTTSVSATSIGATGTAPYIQVSASSAISEASLAFGKVTADFPLHTKDETPTIAPVRQYIVRAYYLTACDDCSGSGDGIPTLKMAELKGGGASGIEKTPLVEGIEDIHFVYGIDLDGDGATDCYAANPQDSSVPTGCSAAAWVTTAPYNWPNVTAVKVYLLARSIDATASWKDSRTYDLGRSQRIPAFDDHYRRQVYTSTISINSVRGARE